MSGSRRKGARSKTDAATDVIDDSDGETTSATSLQFRPLAKKTLPNDHMIPPPWVSKFEGNLLAIIENKLAERLDKLEAVIDLKFDTLKSSVDDLKVKQDHAFSRISQVEPIANQCDNNLKELKQLLSNKAGQLSTLKIELDDLRNRQTRKTLIFYSFPEGSDESWDDCKELVENHISECSLEEVAIDRAHRIHRKDHSQDQSQSSSRPIVAEFLSWQDSNYILQNARKLSHRPSGKQAGKERQLKIHVQQVFGKKTMEERSEMLKIRKYFLLNNKGWKINLVYTASLFVNKGSGFKKYTADDDNLTKANKYFHELNKLNKA